MPAAVLRNTVLVVEDDPGLRDFYRAALTSAGYAVIAVEDGLDALRRIDHHLPSAVVLDLSLPRLSGRDVHHELRSRSDTRDIPIVLVTGTDVSEIDARDFACVLRKPIDADALVLAVEDCLRGVRRIDPV